MLSYKGSQDEDYTQLVCQIIEEAGVDEEGLMRCSDQHKNMMPKELDKRLDDCLMKYLRDVALQQIQMILEASTETPEPHGFKIEYCCVFAGVEESEGRQNQRSVINKREATLSHENDYDHFQSSCASMEEQLQEPIVAENMVKSAHKYNLEDKETEG